MWREIAQVTFIGSIPTAVVDFLETMVCRGMSRVVSIEWRTALFFANTSMTQAA